MEQKSSKVKKSTIVIVFLLITIFTIIKIPNKYKIYNNEDATHHVLHTMKCYEETPISVHKFLPIVSLGNIEDKNISWGACILGNEGNYYYTSFSPAGFVAPYIFVKLFHLPINIYSLYAFNTIICIASLIILMIILCKLFSKYINKNWIILITAICYLFQLEIMHSQGVIYWVHSLMQLLICVQFLLFLNYKKSKKCKIWFYIMCLILPYVEWTGYVSNVAYAFIMFVQSIIENKKLSLKSFKPCLIIGGITCLSFAIFSMHYLLNVDFNIYINALKDRFLVRSANKNIKFKNLLEGYVISYKYLLILCGVLILLVLFTKKTRKKLFDLIKEYKYVCMYFVIILLENIIMLQHAIAYTFDRLKLIYILLVILFINISVIIECKRNRENLILSSIISILLVISIVNVIQYRNGYAHYMSQEVLERRDNEILGKYIIENFNDENSVMVCNNIVRGYINLLFERGVYEGKQYQTAIDIAKEKNKKYLLYLNTNNMKYSVEVLDLQENKKYMVTGGDNNVVVTDDTNNNKS